jgi:hypothetical protein
MQLSRRLFGIFLEKVKRFRPLRRESKEDTSELAELTRNRMPKPEQELYPKNVRGFCESSQGEWLLRLIRLEQKPLPRTRLRKVPLLPFDREHTVSLLLRFAHRKDGEEREQDPL